MLFFRTAKDIKPLNSCEIPPARIEKLEEVGQGAFGKVHKAKLIDGLEFFNKNTKDCCEKNFKYKIVAVKELHGGYESVYSCITHGRNYLAFVSRESIKVNKYAMQASAI